MSHIAILLGVVLATATITPASAHEHCPPAPDSFFQLTAKIAAVEQEYREHLAQPIDAQRTATYVALNERLDRIYDEAYRHYECNQLEAHHLEQIRALSSPLGGPIEDARRAAAKHTELQRFEQEVRAQGWSADVTRFVLERKIQIGMTDAQVRMAWGDPEGIHETVTADSKSEQWTYSGARYVYFKNGRLTTIQRPR
jgi:hypothetical protein